MIVWLFLGGLALLLIALFVSMGGHERYSIDDDVDDMVLHDMQQYDDDDMVGEPGYYD